jgi:hypothetical protein
LAQLPPIAVNILRVSGKIHLVADDLSAVLTDFLHVLSDLCFAGAALNIVAQFVAVSD